MGSQTYWCKKIEMSNSLTNESEKKVALPVEWPYRLLGNLIFFASIFILTLLIITAKHKLVSKTIFDMKEIFYEWTSKIGFTIDDVIIENRSKTSLKEIEEKIKIGRNDNILNLNLKDIKDKLEETPWIKNASVKRSFFPNILHIYIKEKEVVAIWQKNNLLNPIDTDGKVINVINYIPKTPMLLIIGDNAPEHIKDFLDIIKEDEEVFKRIKVATFISNRRWDIILDDHKTGINIKLPEKNLDKAWKKLIKINNSDGILKRKLTKIDLRLADKIIIKIDQEE